MKVDKVLILFMINILVENVWKYILEGGIVKIYVKRIDEYVEIFVEDNGCGFLIEDIMKIIGEKVYDF